DVYEDFLAAFPEYATTHAIDALRVREYRRLDDQRHAYLDYTGGSLHAASQVLEHAALLNEHVYGNPHSASPSSHGMTTLVERARLDGMLAAPSTGPGLFAFPAQSNFTGVRHPLDLVELAHARGWDVLLDAAAFVPTSRLDLAAVKPDFVSVSFYKMFGYPTGVGCLLARTHLLGTLRRPWFAGGTVN